MYVFLYIDSIKYSKSTFGDIQAEVNKDVDNIFDMQEGYVMFVGNRQIKIKSQQYIETEPITMKQLTKMILQEIKKGNINITKIFETIIAKIEKENSLYTQYCIDIFNQIKKTLQKSIIDIITLCNTFHDTFNENNITVLNKQLQFINKYSFEENKKKFKPFIIQYFKNNSEQNYFESDEFKINLLKCIIK